MSTFLTSHNFSVIAEKLKFCPFAAHPVSGGAGGILEARSIGPNRIFWFENMHACVRATLLCHPNADNTWLKMTTLTLRIQPEFRQWMHCINMLTRSGTVLRRWTKRKRKDVKWSSKLLLILITSLHPPSHYLQYWGIVIYSAVPPAPPPAVLLFSCKIYGDAMCRSLMNVQYSHDGV